MYSIGDYVVYKRDVCKIVSTKVVRELEYFVLESIDDTSLKISVPKNSSVIRPVASMEECNNLINSIPSIDVISVSDKKIEIEYKKLLNSGSLKDLVKIIKTTYLRNKKRLDGHKKIGETDDSYFNKAEKLLYNELSISLGLTYDDTKKYIKEAVENLIKE